MKTTLLLFLLTITVTAYGQIDILTRYQTADSLMRIEQFSNAYPILKGIEASCDRRDTLYPYILWGYIANVTELERSFAIIEQWDSALAYAQEALALIERGEPLFNEEFAAREFWMRKNIIVAYFGMGAYDSARRHQELLYKAYREKRLPEGIDEYYNFSFFRWEDVNVWGYEWYPELGDPETKGSFSKIVYYVYSTYPDGSDRDQLYRVHVLKFHKLTDNSVSFDYVLTKRLETAPDTEVSGTLYAYTYNRKIDYEKLQADIREVLKGNYEGGNGVKKE